jgi:hypothetical protein
MKESKHRGVYKHLKDKNGQWVERDDAFIRHRNKQGVMAGGVSIGFTGYGRMNSRPSHWARATDWTSLGRSPETACAPYQNCLGREVHI